MSPPHHEATTSPVGAGEMLQQKKSSGPYIRGGQLSRHTARTQACQCGGEPGTHPTPGEGTVVLGLPPVTGSHITMRHVRLMHGRFPAPRAELLAPRMGVLLTGNYMDNYFPESSTRAKYSHWRGILFLHFWKQDPISPHTPALEMDIFIH